ncbi:hypothetical protein BKA81DRAFT_346664 [Phyllosticta paracitricarpa]
MLLLRVQAPWTLLYRLSADFKNSRRHRRQKRLPSLATGTEPVAAPDGQQPPIGREPPNKLLLPPSLTLTSSSFTTQNRTSYLSMILSLPHLHTRTYWNIHSNQQSRCRRLLSYWRSQQPRPLNKKTITGQSSFWPWRSSTQHSFCPPIRFL